MEYRHNFGFPINVFFMVDAGPVTLKPALSVESRFLFNDITPFGSKGTYNPHKSDVPLLLFLGKIMYTQNKELWGWGYLQKALLTLKEGTKPQFLKFSYIKNFPPII